MQWELCPYLLLMTTGQQTILSHSWFPTMLSRNRFKEILRYIHVADNSKALDRNDPNYDKLWKVRPFLDVVSERSLQLYAPHPQLSVDESIRLALKAGYHSFNTCQRSLSSGA